MFSGCKEIKSLNLSSFDTSNIVTMEEMFSDCENLQYINLLNIKTDSLLDMPGMFKNCKNLNYVNLLNIEIYQNIQIFNFTYGTSNNIIYCMNDESKAMIIKEEFDKLENSTNNCTILCKIEDKNYISDIGICSINCENEENKKYILDNIRVEDCPISFPYEYILYNLCYQSCFSDDFFLKK